MARQATGGPSTCETTDQMSKVIVVDDDHNTTNLVKMLLEMDGYEVTTCTDSKTALDEANEETTAFIIDCYLGKNMSGIDILRRLRGHDDPAIREIPIIMVSGDQRLAEEVLDAGADRFLIKPYSPANLGQEIEDLIAARTRRS
jgi:DNA-binding response OmpR family regulator